MTSTLPFARSARSSSRRRPRARTVALGADARVVALMNLGVVELWSARLADAEQHLEGPRPGTRARRPFVEISCLSHLSLVISTRSFAPARPGRGSPPHRRRTRLDGRPCRGHRARVARLDGHRPGPLRGCARRLGRAAPLLRAEIEPAGALFVQFVWGDLLSGRADSPRRSTRTSRPGDSSGS